MARVLRSTPSNAGDVGIFQKFLMSEVDTIHCKHHDTRTSFLSTAQEYMQQYQGPDNMASLMEAHVQVLCKLGMVSAEAEQMVAKMFEAQPGDILGKRDLCVSMFSFSEQSMWHGTPSNDNVRKLARNMISSGFHLHSVIASRTLTLMEPDRQGVSFHLLLGDGSTRAVAACIVWMLLVKHVDKIPYGDPQVEQVVRSLLSIQVSFERHGTGTPKEALLAQASRQNQAASVQPLHTLAWIGMVKSFTGLAIGNHPLSTIQLQKTMEDMVSTYNAHPEIEAYDKDIVPRKKRKVTGGRKNIIQDEDRDIGLRIGRKRLIAMKCFLAGATDVVLQDLLTHLVMVGDYRTSVVSDDLLQLKFLYVNSKLGKEHLPSDSDLATREAVAEACSKLIPENVSKIEIRFDLALSADDFRLMMSKIIRVYEADIAGLDSHEAKVRCRPNEEGYLAVRKIVQLWSQAIEPMARLDMTKEDFDEFERLVMSTDQLDREILSIVDRAPKYFHMGLLPCVAGLDDVDPDTSVSRVSAAQAKAEAAQYEVFEAELLDDWNLITLAAHGQQSLKELVAWLDNKHRRQQSLLGVELVGAHCKTFFPLCEMPSWDKVSGQVSLLIKSWDKAHGDTRAVLVMDFNVPGARDSLKLHSMLHCAASVAQNIGPASTVLVVWMPSISKDGGSTTAFDDEVIISHALTKAGFKQQDRIMMMLAMSPSQHKMVSSMDWFLNGRLCYFENDTISSKDNFWQQNSELARTRTVRQVAMLPEPSALIETASLGADEDLNNHTRYLEVSEKCAQRGVEVSLVQLKALLQQTDLQRAGSKWLQRADKTIVVDFQPHVGDRALASHEFAKTSGGSHGALHHIIVAVGKGVHHKHACYAAERVACVAAGEWLGETLTMTGPDGQVVRPVRDAGPPTQQELMLYPGAAEALAGVHKLEFRSCSVVGNKVKIRADKLATFAVLGPEAILKIDKLRSKHTEMYESAFSGLGAAVDPESETKQLEDNRPKNDTDPEPSAEQLMVFESEQALHNTAKISASCKSAAKGVQMFFDDSKKTMYLMAIKEDLVVKPGEMLGGIGGGNIVDRDPDLVRAVPWSLPTGDKTWVQLSRDKDTADEDGGKSKYWSGSLYSILRDVESKCTKPIKLTSFGEAVPVSEGGQQHYQFKCPETAENHRCMDYVPTACKAGSKVTAQNFFTGLVTRESGLGAGVLRTTWRLQFDPVAHTLKPTKVHVTCSERITLSKGQPVKVVWPCSE